MTNNCPICGCGPIHGNTCDAGHVWPDDQKRLKLSDFRDFSKLLKICAAEEFSEDPAAWPTGHVNWREQELVRRIYLRIAHAPIMIETERLLEQLRVKENKLDEILEKYE